MITRRGFMAGILAIGAAPAIVRADALMRVVPLHMDLWGIGVLEAGRLQMLLGERASIEREILGRPDLYPMQIGRIDRFTIFVGPYIGPGVPELLNRKP